MTIDDIKYMRERFMISQATLASYLGIAQSSYNRYELGICRVPDDIMIELEEVFKYIEDDGDVDVLETKDFEDYTYEDLNKHPQIAFVNLYYLLHSYASTHKASNHMIALRTGILDLTICKYMSWREMRKLQRMPKKSIFNRIAKLLEVDTDDLVQLLINNGKPYKSMHSATAALRSFDRVKLTV